MTKIDPLTAEATTSPLPLSRKHSEYVKLPSGTGKGRAAGTSAGRLVFSCVHILNCLGIWHLPLNTEHSKHNFHSPISISKLNHYSIGIGHWWTAHEVIEAYVFESLVVWKSISLPACLPAEYIFTVTVKCKRKNCCYCYCYIYYVDIWYVEV